MTGNVLERSELCQLFYDTIDHLKDYGIDQKYLQNALDSVYYDYLVEISAKNTLDRDDLSIISRFLDRDSCIIEQEMYGLIFQMKNFGRVKTNGACQLDKVFVSQYVFDELSNRTNLPKSTELFITKVRILPCQLLIKDIIGLSRSKYRVQGKDLVLLGSLSND